MMSDLNDHGYELIGADPYALLDHDNPFRPLDPDPLHVDAYEDGYVAGVAHGVARERRRDRFGALALAAAIGALLVVTFFVGRASAAPRPAASVIPTVAPGLESPGAGSASAGWEPSQPTGAPPDPGISSVGRARRAGMPLGGVAGSNPAPGATGGASPELGTAIESGIVAYATRSFGPRYLAIPQGPGVRVRICSSSSRSRCLDRISTDAGPELRLQRAGRIADVSYVDFAWLCRCDPPKVGLIIATIEWTGPGLTPPPTDIQP